jgi:hypothetical protein
MKVKILLLVLFLIFEGCEIFEEFNYVKVNVTGTVHVAKYDTEKSEWGETIDGEAVEMILIKAGGERIEGTGRTGGGDGQATIHGTFNLYKEQPIEFKAKLVSNPMVIGSDKIDWDYVNQNRKYGGKNQPDICVVNLYIPLKVPIN